MTVTFSLRLGDDGSPEGDKKYIRLPPPADSKGGYILRFILTAGSSAIGNANLLTNYPVEGKPFERTKDYKLPFVHDELTDAILDLKITQPGAFEYYVEYRDIKNPDQSCQSKSKGSFVVDPRLYVPKTIDYSKNKDASNKDSASKVILPLDGIVILTVIAKWLPVVSSWESFFRSFSQAGYNMAHFAPVNQRGVSNSPYALFDQLMLSNDLFEEKLEETMKENTMKNMLDTIKEKYGIISVTDVVWNHTACNSEWLLTHPEAGYNLKNSPHLKLAYEVDEALVQFSHDLHHTYGFSSILKSEQDLDNIMALWKEKAFPQIRLWEFYVIDIQSGLDEFQDKWNRQQELQISRQRYANEHLSGLSLKDRANLLKKDALKETNLGSRFSKKLDMLIVISFIDKYLTETNWYEEPKHTLQALLNEINLAYYQECDEDIFSIHEQIKNRARYLRVSDHGPKLGPLSRENPLVDTYFTRLPLNEKTKNFHSDELILANNGWIWNADPLVNFAAPGAKAYLRREVIAWGDCVKLNYGNGPEDNPWLWSHMKEYTEKMARLFDGFRIDNCHSTPIHVASYLLDVGRKVKPDLYVFAELFTGSEEKDIIFVSTLGINSLIREAMNAWDAGELSRLVHRHGGQPVGSLTLSSEYFPMHMLGHPTVTDVSKKTEHSVEDMGININLNGSKPHALFMDCTHDNETPHQKRTAEDTLPNAAVVAMTNCAIGSVKGYDEVVPELLNVVSETRKYRVPDRREGIFASKTILQHLHTKMAQEGYSEVHVHQENDYISIHRVHPITHDGFLLISRSAFKNQNDYPHGSITLKNQKVQLLQSASLKVNASKPQVGLYRRLSFSSSNQNASFIISDSPLQGNRIRSEPVSPIASPMSDPHVPFNFEMLSESMISNDDSLLLPEHNASHPTTPTTPNSLYHYLGVIPDIADIASAKLMARRLKSRVKHFGVITGLPSTLEFSTTDTDLVDVKTKTIGPNHLETVISVNEHEFTAGSIVLFRTWAVGSGMDANADWADASKIVPDRLNTLPPIQLFREVQYRPDVHCLSLAVPTDTRKFGINTVEEQPILVQLWSLLGMSGTESVIQIESAIDFMLRMGWDVLYSANLWFTDGSQGAKCWPPGLWESVKMLTPDDLNVALYRVHEEEDDSLRGHGSYNIPGYGHLPYCGLQGFASLLYPAARNNDLGHPIFGNLRAGAWMMDYIINRLDRYIIGFSNLKLIRDWMHERFELIRKLSSSFLPKYFSMVVLYAYQALRYQGIAIASSLVKNNKNVSKNGHGKNSLRAFICKDLTSRRVSSLETFAQSLIMTSYQVYGRVHTTGLFPRSYPLSKNNDHMKTKDILSLSEPSLAAGLPHFSTHHMRCWGRDIFIALPGLLLQAGQFDAAKSLIIAFGSTLKHGLIPNLLDRGIHPRYNARDAVWFWLWSVQEYCRLSPEGLEFLNTTVVRRFPPCRRYRSGTDDYLTVDDDLLTNNPDGDIFVDPNSPNVYVFSSTLAEMVFEILERHARGIKFREWNAGPNLDHAMSTNGFDLEIGTKWADGTGFVFGGSKNNCGTWMDKMGDSAKSGNIGVPATPRDGSPIEIVGLQKACLRWIVQDLLSNKNVWHFPGVFVDGKTISFERWNEMVQTSFEKNFFIPSNPEDDAKFNIGRGDLINRRGIYKDVVGSSLPWCDFQLRPNFAIAMVVAPEIFDLQHAREALSIGKEALLGPLGIKTLDPNDWAYRGIYDNSNDGNDPSIAHGHNYHQGPEWVWVAGYFLRAYLKFFAQGSKDEVTTTVHSIQRVLLQHKTFITDTQNNPYAGLPELTNMDGLFCSGSCPTQAWSSATMIELVRDLNACF